MTKRSIRAIGCFGAALFFMIQGVRAQQQDNTIVPGKWVTMEYVLRVDGQEIENSKPDGALHFKYGAGAILPGLERQLEGLAQGAHTTIVVQPEEGYGPFQTGAFKEMPKSAFPSSTDMRVGSPVTVSDGKGNMQQVTIWSIREDTVVLNCNHPLAGKELQFDVTIVDIQETINNNAVSANKKGE